MLEPVLRGRENLEHGDTLHKLDWVLATWEVMMILRDNIKQKQWTKAEKALVWVISVFTFIGSLRIHELLNTLTTE